MMEAVHDADLLPNVVLLLRRVRLDELPRPNLLRCLLHQFKDLTELPPANTRTQARTQARTHTRLNPSGRSETRQAAKHITVVIMIIIKK